MSQSASLLAHGALGWAVCGAAIGLGRQFLSLDATLLVHAVIAPLAFGLLSWHHFGRFPSVSPLGTALGLLGVVVTLDSLIVVPFIEHSYAMFRSALGTWIPFTLIVTASYSVGRAVRQRNPASGNAGLPKPQE